MAELAWASAASQGTLSLALVSARISPAHLLTAPPPSLGTTVLGEERPQGLHLSSGRQGP